MKVHFYVLQRDDKSNQTRLHLVFTDEPTELAVGKTVEHKGTSYQVDSIEILDSVKRELNAVC